MELSTRDVVARSIYTEVKEGRGTPHGGAYLDVSHLDSDYVRRKLPSMYDQFLELAGVDITKEPMQVGPTCHYFMGGIKVDADTGATRVPGLYATGEASGGMNGANRLGGNSLGDLLVFGRRAGIGAAADANSVSPVPLPADEVATAQAEVDQYLNGKGTENPFQMHKDLQKIMGDGVGIFRDKEGLTEAIDKLESLEGRIHNLKAPSNRLEYNPGWRLCREMKNMLTVSLMIARGALMREESRGGHSRLDFTAYSDYWAENNIVVSSAGGLDMTLTPTPVFKRDELSELVEARKESEKAS
jgi:succinate dehydrogenase / fumarate reductase flavoprotein subunit